MVTVRLTLLALCAAILMPAQPAAAARDWTGGPVVVAPWPATAERPHLDPIVFGAVLTAKGEAIVVHGHWGDGGEVTASATVTDTATGVTTEHVFPPEARFSSTSLATGPSGQVVLAMTSGRPHRIEYFTRAASGAWSEPKVLGAPDSAHRNGVVGPAISINARGDAVMMFTGQDVSAGGKVQNYAAFAPAGEDFGEPLPIGGPEDVGIVSHNISLGDDGIAVAGWRHAARSDGTGVIKAAFGTAAGFGEPQVLSDPARDAKSWNIRRLSGGRTIAHWQETDPTIYHQDHTFTDDTTGRYVIAAASGDHWAAPEPVEPLGDDPPRTLVRYDHAGNLLLVPTEYMPALGEGIWLLEGNLEDGIRVTARVSVGHAPEWAALNDAGDAVVGFRSSDTWWPKPTWWTSAVSMRRSRDGAWGPLVDLTRPCRYFMPIGGAIAPDGTAFAVGTQPVGGGWPEYFSTELAGVQLLWDRPSEAEPPAAECATAPVPGDPPAGPPPPYEPPRSMPIPPQGEPVQVRPEILRLGKPRLETRRGRRYVTGRFTCTIRCDLHVRSAFSAKGVRSFHGPSVRLARRRAGVVRVPISGSVRRRLAGRRRVGVVLWGHASVEGLPVSSALTLDWLRLPRAPRR